MKFSTIIAIALIAAPTLAISAEEYDERSYDIAETDFYGRDANDFVDHLTREELDELEDILGRELVDDIEERSPFIFGAVKAAFKVGKMAVGAIRNRNKRDLEFDEDLEIREPALRRPSGNAIGNAINLFSGATQAAGVYQQHQANKQQKRDLEFDEDLEVREPALRGIGSGVGNAINLVGGVTTAAQVYQQHKANKQKRDLEFGEDLEIREPRISGKAVGNAINLFSGATQAAGLYQASKQQKRDLEFGEDLEIREPALPRISGKGVGNAINLFSGATQAAQLYQQSKQPREVLEEREFDEEVFEREFDEEYFEREFDDLD